jgi:hypothetical protein
MKHLQKYENFLTDLFKKKSDEPRVGDYVLCERDNSNNHMGTAKLCSDFIENNIGLIINHLKSKISDSEEVFRVKYENVPEKLKGGWFFHSKELINCYYYITKKHEIKHWSKNREDLETILSANKYNL